MQRPPQSDKVPFFEAEQESDWDLTDGPVYKAGLRNSDGSNLLTLYLPASLVDHAVISRHRFAIDISPIGNLALILASEIDDEDLQRQLDGSTTLSEAKMIDELVAEMLELEGGDLVELLPQLAKRLEKAAAMVRRAINSNHKREATSAI